MPAVANVIANRRCKLVNIAALHQLPICYSDRVRILLGTASKVGLHRKIVMQLWTRIQTLRQVRSFNGIYN